MTPDRPVLIAGGGIGGLAAALALARHGIAAHVLERRAAFSEAGAGIQLSPNAVHVLDRLGVADRLATAVGVPDAIIVHEAAGGRALRRLPLGAWIRDRHGAPYWLAHRRDLQAALLAAVREEPLARLTTGFEAHLFETATGGVRLVGLCGSSLEGAALIGADGVFSRVRRQLLGTPEPRFSGMTAARTVIASERVAANLDAHSVGVWLAPGAHVVHYPVRGGRELAVVVITRTPEPEHGWALPVAPDDVLACLTGFAPRLRQALGSAPEWRRWALYELEPLARWSIGCVALLGDAAHPMLPFLAQGGALALEDAVVLADRLAGSTDVPGGLAAYERSRMRRANAVVAAARRNGRIFHLGGATARVRDAVIRLAPPHPLMSRYDWVYGWRAEAA